MPDINMLEIGLIAAIFLFAIREFFGYLRVKKNGNGNYNKVIFDELCKMNENHLKSIERTIEDGNSNLIKTIHDDNMKMVSILSEIKGGLNK